MIGDSSLSTNRGQLSSTLHERIQNVQRHEIRQDAVLQQNWQKGNWNVRGISLDPERPADSDDREATKIHVCIIVADVNDSKRIWVGRTDGGVLYVQLGDEYWTKFQSTLSATGDNNSVQTSSKLVRRESSSANPFELLVQTQGGNTAITCLLTTEDSHLFTTNQGSGDIQQWLFDDDHEWKLVPIKTLQAHASDIVTLRAVSLQANADASILFSASVDGGLALWDMTGDLLFECHVGESISCADSDGTHIFVGLASGQVMVYAVKGLMKLAADGSTACPLPNGQWVAGTEGSAVTAIACAGAGTLGRGRDQPTILLLTGDQQGNVKQWEVLTRSVDGVTKLEQWPKLSTQRLPKKAHVFPGHEGRITAIRAIDDTKFLSASTDGTIIAWNPTSGKKMFQMDGFTEELHSLCLQDHTLITDGMNEFVCVHDFDIPEAEEDYDLDFEG